eukprot:TRINITY_DN5847_c0_g1_i3.p1 TRINITY_DN5847_c0_g1~~TRINITY_DN5847_c0_g1_i3.p1  ORF type:complete len:231 (-),score=27.40 TRINITY_DN5847_c0_g1_i3:809-1501(-)
MPAFAAVLLVWFGPPPGWAPFTLETMRRSTDIDWHVFSDHPKETWLADTPGKKAADADANDVGANWGRADFANIYFHDLNASAFSALALAATGVDVPAMDGYKLCDWRMTYGEVFKEWLRGYEFWGWVDLDVFLGNLRHFGLNASALAPFDVVGEHGWPIQGPLTLLRNTAHINRSARFLCDAYCIRAVCEVTLMVSFCGGFVRDCVLVCRHSYSAPFPGKSTHACIQCM